jgi:hypothetical protein
MRIRIGHMLTMLVVIALFMGCSGYRAQYDIGLIKADRPQGAMQQYGEQDILKVEEDGPDQSYFEDGFVKIMWIPTAEEIALELTNKTAQPIKILWDDAKIIDDKGDQHRIIRSGIEYSKADQALIPSMVEANGTIKEKVFPADNLFYSDARWQRKPMFPNFAVSRKAEHFDENVQEYVGKSFKILLPLETSGTVHEYSFTFAVSSVEVVK